MLLFNSFGLLFEARLYCMASTGTWKRLCHPWSHQLSDGTYSGIKIKEGCRRYRTTDLAGERIFTMNILAED